MPVYKVNIKWGKEKFEDVELNTEEPTDVFKAQLFALSSVPPERQKVMLKGAVLKDDSWDGFKLKNGVTLMMMGSADALPQAPATKTMFVEDMSESQLASAYDLPAGLNNLGNTCYMNATVQCLRNIPELKSAILNVPGQLGFGGSDALGSPESVTLALRDLYKSMDKTSEPMPPIIFLQILHKAFPQFAERTEQGVYAQQDANECWTQIVRILQQKLPGEQKAIEEGKEEEKTASKDSRGFMDQYFGLESESIMKCVEAPDEEPVKSKETLFQLSCFISQEVKYIHTGLQSRLTESITKNSPTLNRDAEYIKTSKLSRLPAYLTVQLVRFYFKEKESVNAKILKDVKFPLVLDVFDLCTEELQNKLIPQRTKFKEMEDRKLEEARNAKANAEKAEKPEQKEQPMDIDKKKKIEPFSFPDDIGSNNSGYYELKAVLTHQGRSSSSGHYVAWIRKDEDEWYKCDDDNISRIYSEDVLKLSGGGDWHCAYVLLYGPRQLEITDESS